MKFITAEQFSKADKKVRDSIMEWWEPKEYDLAIYYGVVMLSDQQLKYGTESVKATFIPLLTVGQLIEFIEWKNNNSFEIRISCADAKNTLLESLWETAQKVCE